MNTVKSGREKQQAYTQSFDTLKKAMQNSFYLEAVVITYAIMEDRLVSFLHHAGVLTRDKGELRIDRKLYPYMRELLGKSEEEPIKIKDISVKIMLIDALLNMTDEKAQAIDAAVAQKAAEKVIRTKALPNYMETLCQQIDQTLDDRAASGVLSDIEQWRGKRNQLIHALLSKTVSTSEPAKKECAEAGCKLARDVDNILVKPFKKKNNIRKKYNIQ